MISRKFKKRDLFFIVVIVASLVLVSLFLKPLLQNKRLESSLARFSEIAFLENPRAVRRNSPPVAVLFADEGAIWEIESSGSDNIQISSDIWPGENKDDKEFFTDNICAKLSSECTASWNDFQFWRGEIVLGQGTICPRLHCNYYVLSNGQRAFIWLFNI